MCEVCCGFSEKHKKINRNENQSDKKSTNKLLKFNQKVGLSLLPAFRCRLSPLLNLTNVNVYVAQLLREADVSSKSSEYLRAEDNNSNTWQPANS